MRGILSALVNFLSDKQSTTDVNMSLLIITLIALLVAIWICIVISKKNKLYINQEKANKDNAYT